jgi:exopolysaccharide biosynthesis polyprenyl glycosylphosphotransferase
MHRRLSGLASDALLQIADLVALSLALPVAYRLHQLWRPEPLPTLELYWRALVVGLLIWVTSAWLHRLYDERPRAGRRAILRLTQSLGVVALVTGAAVFVFAPAEAGRPLTVIYFAVAWLLLATNRVAFRLFGAVARRRGLSARRFAVVGAGIQAREIADAIASHPDWGYQFVGFVLPEQGARSRGPVLGKLSRLDTILQEHVIDEVVFAVNRDRLDDIERAVQACEELGVDYQISLDLLRFGQAPLRIGDLDGFPTLAYARAPTDSMSLSMKRLFDMAVGAAVLALLSPVLLAVAVAIRFDSPGPVFFRQRRVGLNGRGFTMYKFRSMFIDAEARLEALKAHNEMDGPVFKMRNDPRITRVGRFLRKTSLDEFPQFINVLSGQMSVVGPRPPLPGEVRQYKPWQRRRLSMKPGITCIWQVSGRNDIDFDHWMELDLEYIDHWSLWRDFEICLKTIPAVLSARGAS